MKLRYAPAIPVAIAVLALIALAGCAAKVQDRMVVQFSYKGSLADGTVFDQSEEGQPIEFIFGTGTMIPGLETGMKGLKAGDAKVITVSSAEAYGPRNEAAVQEVPRDQLPEDIEVGQQLAGQTEGGMVYPTVKEIRDDVVVMDFNHPLAGQDLTFDIKVVSLRRATQEELAQVEAQAAAASQAQ